MGDINTGVSNVGGDMNIDPGICIGVLALGEWSDEYAARRGRLIGGRTTKGDVADSLPGSLGDPAYALNMLSPLFRRCLSIGL